MSGGFYRAFEDRYRGTRAMIRERLTVYLPFVKPLRDSGMSSALDLGCGRGEWLELLGEAGFDAKGVDMDEGMLAACRERGLKAINGDALEVLRAQPEGSLAVVSAFHLVEHITFDMVQTLIGEAMRVLQPGGLLILETPNSENLVVGSSSFYDDPSHLRPIPPKLLAFAVEYGGFARHRILRLQEGEHLHSDLPVQLFDVLGGVSPDYSVIAQKACAPANLSMLDGLFNASYGVDLHTLAQRYQSQVDTLHIQLGQLHDQQSSFSTAVQGQVEKISAQIEHLHSTTVALGSDVAEHETSRTELAGQVETINSQIAHVYSTTVALASDIAEHENTRTELLKQVEAINARIEQLDSKTVALTGDIAEHETARVEFHAQALKLETMQSEMSKLLELAETAIRRTQETRNVRTNQLPAQLRSQISTLNEQHQTSLHESARLAAHVAWIEGRLTHSEAEAAALRYHLAELMHRRLSVRMVRFLGRTRRRLVGAALSPNLRRPTAMLLRRTIQLVLRRPALKRIARRVIARFPQLHTRLLRLMYAPAPIDVEAPVDTDPLAAQMSPRSLRIYRAMLAASKHED